MQDPAFQLLYFGADYPYTFFGFGFPRAWGSYKSMLLRDPDSGDFELWAANRWSHVCLAFRKADGFLSVVKDGGVLNINHADPELTGVTIPADFLRKVSIGRCNFDYKMSCTSPEGRLADFNVWDRALSTRELLDWTTCRSMAKGSLVNWDTASFVLVNMREKEAAAESLCVPARPGDVVMPEKRPFADHVAMCAKWRGLATVVTDSETQHALVAEIMKYPVCTKEGE